MPRPDRGKVTVFCAWCGEPTKGRGTRKFCQSKNGKTSPCRSQHWRWQRLKRKAVDYRDEEE